MSEGFAAQLNGFRVRTIRNVEAVKRAVAIKLFTAIILGTPVLTGRLRGNWQTTIASPALDTIDVRTTEAALAELVAAATSATGDAVIIMRNNLVYVIPIEFEGHSKNKAPQGMVRINVERFRTLLAAEVARGNL